MARQMKDSGIEWIGEIPETWNQIRLKYCCSVLNGFPFDSKNFTLTEGFPLIRIRDITSGCTETRYNGPFDSAFVVNNGDLLVGMDGDFNIRLWDGGMALLNQRCCKLIEEQGITRQFLFYYLPFRLKWVNDLTYATTVKHLSSGDIVETALFVPSIAEQQRIAAFLDRKCAEIDAVIERTKATIEEYKKLKQAVITEAVTKGVRGPRPLKDSGIKWIGEMPEEWTTVQLKRLARIATGNTPPKNEESTFYSQDSGCLWIKAEDLGTSNNIETTTEYLTEDGKHEGRVFPPCTVYVCCIASVGKVGFCLTEASCNQQINGLFFENAHWKYGFYMSLAQEEEYLLNASGNVMKILNTEKQSRLMCPYPPIDEQLEIATYLDEKCAALDTLIAKKTALLTELETYKKSLIYEYVTGKKEV